MVPRHAPPISIYVSAECLRPAVPGQELEEIDMTNNIFSELTAGHIQQLQRAELCQYMEANRTRHDTKN